MVVGNSHDQVTGENVNRIRRFHENFWKKILLEKFADTEHLQGLARAGEFVMNISGELLVTNSRELLVIRNNLRYSQHIPESLKLENLSLTFVTWVALFKNSRLSGLTSTLES